MATEQVYSPYKAAKLISAKLGKEVRPQQIYGYIRKNEKLQKRNELGHLIVNEAFIEAYVSGRKEAAAKKEAAKKAEVAA